MAEMTREQREEVSHCEECMSAKCSVCGHEPCPACIDDCDDYNCIEWSETDDSGKKKHACVFVRCQKHAVLPPAWERFTQEGSP